MNKEKNHHTPKEPAAPAATPPSQPSPRSPQSSPQSSQSSQPPEPANQSTADSTSNPACPPAQEEQSAELSIEQQLREEKEKLLRCHAEMDNLRKRTDRQISNAYQYAIEPFANALLEVYDNLERSLSQTQKQSLKDIQKGNELTLKTLSDIFTRFHIETIDPQPGDMFDPQLHQAITAVATKEHPNNAIIELIQKGYRIHEHLLRPAMVVVATEEKKD